jgi:hypothetical protein
MSQGMSVEKIDQVILANAREQYRKVALIIAVARESLGNMPDVDNDTIAARIVVLVEAKKLESQGDLSKWRFSEVRLTPPPIHRPTLRAS